MTPGLVYYTPRSRSEHSERVTEAQRAGRVCVRLITVGRSCNGGAKRSIPVVS